MFKPIASQSELPTLDVAVPMQIDHETATIYVVDPDPSTGKTVREVLDGYRLEVQTFGSGRDFFSAYRRNQPGCLLLEHRIFDISGLQIQRRLAAENHRLPLVYVTSSMDVPTAVSLMRGGAIHILEKPMRSLDLLNAIHEALALDSRQRHEDRERRQVYESISSLTPKERQFVKLLAGAKSTKSIAAELSICSRAVELRRRSVMKKLGFKSALDLIRFAVLADQEFPYRLDAEKSEMSEIWR